MQTFPCGHRVVCRKCFVKTIQMVVSQRLLPLRCVICRAKVLRLKQTDSSFSGIYFTGNTAFHRNNGTGSNFHHNYQYQHNTFYNCKKEFQWLNLLLLGKIYQITFGWGERNNLYTLCYGIVPDGPNGLVILNQISNDVNDDQIDWLRLVLLKHFNCYCFTDVAFFIAQNIDAITIAIIKMMNNI